MSLDGNQTTIFANSVSYTTTSRDISRVMVVIPFTKYTEGITFGDVIRFNNTDGPVSGQYVKSSAASNIGAEVFGIVEGYNSNTKSISVVIQGSVIIPSNKLNIVTTDGNNAGGNDIYFLSGMTAGELQNAAPTTVNFISKPIYQVAPHGEFTGVVKNYLGWKNNSIDPFIVETKLMSMSDDMTKSIYYWEDANRFLIYSQTYDSNTFTKVEEYTIDKSVLETNSNKLLNYDLTDTYDIKISDDGKEILVFDKSLNTISYIHVDQSNNALIKFVLNVDLVGSPQDKIWAVDNNITCLTVGTKSSHREPSIYDSVVTAYDVSSRIEYWKRNMNNTSSPYNWRRTHNNQAYGKVDSKYPSSIINEEPMDEIYSFGGIHRLSDVSCKGSNFALSCKTLIQDQIDYKSKITYITSSRYDSDMFTIISNSGSTNSGINRISVIGETYGSIDGFSYGVDDAYATKNMFQNDIFFTNFFPNLDSPENKQYCCSFSCSHYKILNLHNDYYHEDLYHKMEGFSYYLPGIADYNTPASLIGFNNSPGRTLSNSIKQLKELSYVNQIFPDVTYFEINYGTILTIPLYTRDALLSRAKTTETFVVYAFLYEYTQTFTGDKAKQLIITKYPFFAYDNLNVFSRYTISDVHKRVLPTDGTGFGYITAFQTNSIGPQNLNSRYIYAVNAELIPSVFDSMTTITTPNIDQINNYEMFTSNDRFFICLPSMTLVWTYASSTYVNVMFTNLDTAKFWYNSDGEFFLIDENIYRYNNSSQIFELQII